MWCESMNARCGGGAHGYHDDERRRSRSGEVGPSQFISTCSCVWVCVTSPPSVWERPWNGLYLSLAPCLHTHLTMYLWKKVEQGSGELDVEHSGSGLTSRAGRLTQHFTFERKREYKKTCFFSVFFALEQPVILCIVCKTLSSTTRRLRMLWQNATRLHWKYYWLDANGYNEGTLFVFAD